MDNFNILVSGGHADVDLVSDGWTDIFRRLTGILAREENRDAAKASPAEMAALNELADQQKMQEVRARVDAIVKDPATAEALKPYYRQFCKRPCFHEEYLPTFNRSNVTLVDTLGRGVDSITEKGIMFDGKEYEVDCIIFATGFEVGTDYTSRSGYDVIGRGNMTLSKKWAGGLKTFHGFYTNGFPNCFFMGMTQTGLTANIPHMLNEQANHIAYVINHARNSNVKAVEPTQQAEEDWVSEIHRMARLGERFYAECTPGYYNNEGKPGSSGNGFLNGQYGAGPVAFFNILKKWRDEGELRGLDVS